MPIRLDERLSYIASLSKGGSVADVGCDHGKLGYYLISTDRTDKIIATDVSAASLQKARELAYEGGVSDRMTTRLGDGLAPIESGEVDEVIVAGMGGDVIRKILLDGYESGKRFGRYILSPNTHPEQARRALVEIGQKIEVDDEVECGKKRYVVISSSEGEGALDALQLEFGAFYKTSKTFKERAIRELEYIRSLLEKSPSADGLKRRAQMLETALYNIKIEG